MVNGVTVNHLVYMKIAYASPTYKYMVGCQLICGSSSWPRGDLPQYSSALEFYSNDVGVSYINFVSPLQFILGQILGYITPFPIYIFNNKE